TDGRQWGLDHAGPHADRPYFLPDPSLSAEGKSPRPFGLPRPDRAAFQIRPGSLPCSLAPAPAGPRLPQPGAWNPWRRAFHPAARSLSGPAFSGHVQETWHRALASKVPRLRENFLLNDSPIPLRFSATFAPRSSEH